MTVADPLIVIPEGFVIRIFTLVQLFAVPITVITCGGLLRSTPATAVMVILQTAEDELLDEELEDLELIDGVELDELEDEELEELDEEHGTERTDDRLQAGHSILTVKFSQQGTS